MYKLTIFVPYVTTENGKPVFKEAEQTYTYTEWNDVLNMVELMVAGRDRAIKFEIERSEK